jgi:radical SAM superfamily enzyme YgiQ (UPF0313 family)
MLVYLADLGHNQVTVSSDVYPLGIANLATYLREYGRLDPAPEVRLFREPEALQKALDARVPDVLGLSSYSWNHRLACHYARYAKRRGRDVLTLMGGPNFPLTQEEQAAWIRGMPEIDIHVRGPTYEGERAFVALMQRYADASKSLPGLKEEPVPGSVWLDERTGELVSGPELERIRDLDEIPSPYRTGLMDPFFETGYFPLMQISRGCPFTCAFCNSAVRSNSKVFRHSVEEVCADLLYIAERVRSEIPLCLADDNFGMYPWDEEVAEYVAHLQERFDWPRYIRTTTGKNRSDRIIRVMRKARGVLPMTAAVQSLNPTVLENIERQNISLEAYANIQEEVRDQGMQSYGELILCLPGETKGSFMDSFRDLLASGVQRVSAHQLMLLHGAPLSNPDSRARFGFETKFRVVARNLGLYEGEPVVETEEVVVSTPTFSFEDYLELRVFHLLLTIFYYEGNFEEAFELARESGVEPFDVIVSLQARLAHAPDRFRRLIDDFRRESAEELFDSPEACTTWAHEHIDGLIDGSMGGNLLSKYSMLGRFFVTQDALVFLEDGLSADMVEADSEAHAAELTAVMAYLRAVLLHAPFEKSLEERPEWESAYDVEAWRHEGYARELAAFRLERARRFSTEIEPARRAVLLERVRTFGEHPAGLGKFTRTMFARDLRRKVLEPISAS